MKAHALGELLDQFRADANGDRRSAAALIKRAEQVEYAVLGKCWKQVHRVKLELNKPYIVRRIWHDGSRGDPAVAVWSKSGWETIKGSFYPTTGSGSVEILA